MMENEKLVAFTFDDGPVEYADDSTAMQILRTFEKYGQQATFFYVGEKMNADNKKELDFAQSIGCEAANHTYSHCFLTKITLEEVVEEFEKTTRLLEEYTGKIPVLARIPFMDSNEMVDEASGFPLIGCSVDSQDYTHNTTEEIIQRIMDAHETGELENGVVLLHEPYLTTMKAVEYLVPTLIEKGYRFVTVSELAKRNGVTLQKGKNYAKIEK
ncbi:MAG: polysaccharide deacetylase family protein [Lachnospiraceae bacterium]|nr:polysaccharide deacetylase family protein [Lachnospiraceae bacterium]